MSQLFFNQVFEFLNFIQSSISRPIKAFWDFESANIIFSPLWFLVSFCYSKMEIDKIDYYKI